MSLIIFILVVVVVLALALWALSLVPIPAPANWILQVFAVVLAILAIGNRAGLF